MTLTARTGSSAGGGLEQAVKRLALHKSANAVWRKGSDMFSPGMKVKVEVDERGTQLMTGWLVI
jgi:hypothetical protein